jgi:RimJ/RimL family protein N-acetyltransferase
MWQLDVQLADDYVTLEPLRIAHADELFDVAQVPEIWVWWPFNPARSIETFKDWVLGCERAAREGVRQHFLTRNASTGSPVGSTSYCTIRPEHCGIEIGWTWVAPSEWRSGVNVAAKRLMLSHAFDALGCQRVEFETDAANERSRRALAALPAQFEGVHRDDKRVRGGVRRSSAYYSILDSEWPEVRRNLSDRLRAKP